MFKLNIIEKLKVILNFGKDKKSRIGQGGDGGEVLIMARKIIGSGFINAMGGDGGNGGRGGGVTLIAEENQSFGGISVDGGKSISNLK